MYYDDEKQSIMGITTQDFHIDVKPAKESPRQDENDESSSKKPKGKVYKI